jgi:hypothetical protein
MIPCESHTPLQFTLITSLAFLMLLTTISNSSSASRSPLDGKTINGEVELIVKLQTPSLGGLLTQNSETVVTQPLKWSVDSRGNVYYFSEQSENGKYDQGEMLLLNQEIDLANHHERVDPRVLSNFTLATMKFKTSLIDHVLTISGVLDMT